MTEDMYDSEKYKKILKFHESNEDRGKEVPEKKKLLIFVDSNFTVEEKINMHYILKYPNYLHFIFDKELSQKL